MIKSSRNTAIDGFPLAVRLSFLSTTCLKKGTVKQYAQAQSGIGAECSGSDKRQMLATKLGVPLHGLKASQMVALLR